MTCHAAPMALGRHALWLSIVLVACGQPADGTVQGTPFCRKIRRCLRDALSSSYRPSTHDEVANAAAGCLGHDARSLWTTRDCLPFEFGTDVHGLSVRLAIDCSDTCPLNASLALEFAEAVAPLECECMGYTPRIEPAWGGYGGCIARPHSERFHHEVHPEKDGFMVVTDAEDVTARALGIGMGPLLFIDGTPVDRDRIHSMLQGMSRRVPGAVRLARTHGTSAPEVAATVLHYPPRDVFMELARIADEIDFAHVGVRAATCTGTRGSGFVALGERAVQYEPGCDNDATRRLEPLVAKIRDAAAHAAPRELQKTASPRACAELRSLPTLATLREGGETIELRYADWLLR